MYAPGVTVLVPLKPLAEAKSRLRGAADRHEDLVLELARATVSAALAADGVARVLVVTRDRRAAQALRACGAGVLPDQGLDLNDALRRAASAVEDDVLRRAASAVEDDVLRRAMLPGRGGVARRHGGPGIATGPVAALPADLPAMRPEELSQALAAAGGRRAFVPDASGTGTVLLVASPGGPLDPRFGPDSAAAHENSGALRLTGDWPTLRRDVDTPADLALIRSWGLLRAT
ncbi:2-phospho-L-lactate guanylyltransferase [Catellatospora methionotrophica]|uniref:Phosphoenolpyruvate guanylyltransferase n=1 Tax=Catellatospora methionotrophica TaxID=121620 RepID=A0A8J3LGC2_9ACTN|nr:2-phospho-L-lactate guanylyltransferase [Catellatospora methionotrophica]GIG17825.1 2-phospho-L-lactate guanylyltransferase [Catellatospora methionotrophica]